MRAIDLYAGVGGWSLGLGMAGLEVVMSYEMWAEANITNSRNNRHPVLEVDIRSLDANSLPEVEVVVGSPPCTHFSLANRGGKGNILEGLKDVEKFLEVVQAVRPRFWALENVPRLAAILKSEMNQGGSLHRFSGLNPSVAVVDCSEWGVPQRRKRAIIGNFDLDLMLSYRSSCRSLTLGDVVCALAGDPVEDPVYGTVVPKSELFDHSKEEPLSEEEGRLNRDSKANHPVYNGMSFPDSFSRPSRTVTATCTRVSRESIVIPEGERFRRLTLRERATLQSFPIDYQFYGSTHSQKQKMIGNALPPLISYYVAHAMLGTPAGSVPPPRESICKFKPPSEAVTETRPDRSSSRHSPQRRFRAAVPSLRLKSGTRFELANSFCPKGPRWCVKFFFGDSKGRSEIDLCPDLIRKMEEMPGVRDDVVRAEGLIAEFGGSLAAATAAGLQKAWIHSDEDAAHPHQIVDCIDQIVRLFMEQDVTESSESRVGFLLDHWGRPKGHKKLLNNARSVYAGLIVCSLVNEILNSSGALA